MTKIEELLPQRYPFLFLDEIEWATKAEIKGSKTYDNSFFFYQEQNGTKKIVPNLILIESLVQCGGAGVTQIGILEKGFWGVATLENVKFYGSVELDSTVSMLVKNLKVSNKVLKQRGTALCNGHVIIEATWLCLQLT